MATDPTLPSFLTGGQLNTTESLGKNIPGFAPTSSDQQPKLNVTAPLDVQAAPSQAMALAKALNLGWSIAEPKINASLERKGKQDVAEGEAAATMGNVDQVKAAQIEGYRIGAARVTTEQHTLQAMLDAEKL